MAVDGKTCLHWYSKENWQEGVAPRAKMNQQRGRRFRSAKDAEDARKKAAQKGEEIPAEPFDSNCITPGTVFMAELSKQLRYFIKKKVSEDKDWQGVEIVLSGHEVCHFFVRC